MQKKKNLLLLLAATLLLSGCASNSNASSSNGTSTQDSTGESSTSEPRKVSGSWTDDEKELLKQYCGEVLPYPADGMLNGKVTVSDEYSYLSIEDEESSSFTLEEYYYYLVEAGWTLHKGYNGNSTGTTTDYSGNTLTYCELTKFSEDGSVGYRIYYYFMPAVEADEYSEATPAHHVIRCFNSMTVEKTSYNDWFFDEDTIKNVLTFVLPYMKLGNNYSVGTSWLDSNVLTITDNYVEDLTGKYKDLLLENGFVLSPSDSATVDAYVLYKKLDEYTTVSAALKYFNGNQFVFYYHAKYQVFDAWPTSVLEEYEEESGVTVPQFTSKDGKYYYHKRGDALDIYGYVDSSNDTDMAYYDDLKDKGYSYTYSFVDGSYYLSWSETLKIASYTATNSQTDEEAFGIKVSLYDTDYKLSDSWPTDELSELATKYDIGFDVPEATLYDTSRPIKYQLDEYSWGEFEMRMVIYDPEDDEGNCAYNSYYKALKNKAWHHELDWNDKDVFEDPDGKLKITISWVDSILEVRIGTGSGETHEPVFSFDESEVSLVPNSTYNPEVNIDMLPYDVTYTSNNDKVTVTTDEYGDPVVTVSSDAEVNTTATITASMTLPSGEVKTTTLTVNVVDKIPYTLTSAVDAFAELYGNLSGQSVSRWGEDPYVDTYSSKNKTYYEENISSFLPDGFTLAGDWTDGTFNNPYDETDYYNGSSCHYVDATCSDGITLRFCAVYDNFGGSYTLIVYAFKTPTTGN